MATNKTPSELDEYGDILVRIMLVFLSIALVINCIFLRLKTISKIMRVYMILALVCHIFLLWLAYEGIGPRRDAFSLVICVVLLLVDILALIAHWQPSWLFIVAVVLDLLVAICAYYLCYSLLVNH